MGEARGEWGNQLEFILTMIGYAVGLGNVWRFPFLAFRNGGGAFLIPYVICLVFLGIPMFALECAFGQYGAKGPLSIWSINPLFKGIGATVVFSAFLIFIYYNVVIAIAIRFLIASFTSSLPWVDCDSCECLLYGKNVTIAEAQSMRFNNSLGLDCPLLPNQTNAAAKSPSELYYTNDILGQSSGIEEMGSVRWQILLCNLLAYAIIFVVLVKGIASLGKIVYFTATFPYILLTIILVRAAMLDGASKGVEFYLKPDWDRLSEAKVWSEAATQIFFSISACLGGLIAMSSYNRFDNNIIRDSLIVPIINCLTSFYAGFVVFCTLGYMSEIKQIPVQNVTEGGPGLVFIAYPEAIGAMPVSTLWAVLFFFTICILGFSTQFSNGETVMTSLIDEFPSVFNSKRRQVLLRLAVCLAGFVLGIPICTEGGQYLLNLVDSALLGFPILLVGLFEYIAIIYIYGYNQFAENIYTMIGFRPFFYFKATWCVISPVLLVALIVFKAYGQDDIHPAWSGLIYYLIVIFLVMWVPLGFFYYGRQEICKAMSPLPYWIGRRNQGGDEASPTDKPAATEMELDIGESVTKGGVQSWGSTHGPPKGEDKDKPQVSDKSQEMYVTNLNVGFDNKAYTAND